MIVITLKLIIVMIGSDLDECEMKSDDCHDYAICTDTIGKYNCTCMTGYEGDGINCTSKQVIIITYVCNILH